MVCTRCVLAALPLVATCAVASELTTTRQPEWSFVMADGVFAEARVIDGGYGCGGAGSRSGRLAMGLAVSERPGAPAFEGFVGPGGARVVMGGAGGWVRTVSVTLGAGASLTVIEAYSESGVLLGTQRGGAGSTITLSFPGRIHRVVVRETPGLVEPVREFAVAPGPATLGALALGMLAPMVRRRRVVARG